MTSRPAGLHDIYPTERIPPSIRRPRVLVVAGLVGGVVATIAVLIVLVVVGLEVIG